MVDLATLAAVPMKAESDLRMVEIIMLKWKCPDVEAKCAERIIRYTDWPFKLNVYDNRPNTPNTARAWNKLVMDSTCGYVCLIDSDAFVPDVKPCWLTRMMACFEQPGCRLVVPVTDRCSTVRQRAGRAVEYPRAEKFDDTWSGFCFLFHRNLLDDIGEFDEEFVGYGQDSEFAERLTRNGGGTYIRRDVFVQHLHGASFKAATSSGEHDSVADRAYAQELFARKTT